MKKIFPVRAIETDTLLVDFYNRFNPFEVTPKDSADFEKYLEGLEPQHLKLLKSDKNYYQLTFKNLGGVILPLVLEFEFDDGEKQVKRIPAEIWRYNANKVSKVFMFDKVIKRVVLDPHHELVDANYSNNTLFAPITFEKFEITKQRKGPPNPMQLLKDAEDRNIKKEDGRDEDSDS